MRGDSGLWPPPKVFEPLSACLDISGEIALVAPTSSGHAQAISHLELAWDRYARGRLSKVTVLPALTSKGIRCHIHPDHEIRPQGYRLEVNADGISIHAIDEPGFFYAITTLSQWLHLTWLNEKKPLAQLPGLRIEDWPDFPHRGLMVDISRTKVPTMAELHRIVDLAAAFKINQVQLYMEHTFAYRGHETVWRNASPITGKEIQDLDAYCRARFIELVPNQNSFGHFHQWLKHDDYRKLAECPQGIEHPFSLDNEPFSLCPTDPGTLPLLSDLFAQLLPNFSSRIFNVGLDETFDLGQGRSAEVCQTRGKTTVYLDFLNQIHALLGEKGFRMQFWGDIIIQKPEELSRLPQDVIALEWGYEADHPFETHGEQFRQSGREFYVCPGTSSWSSVVGRIDNAMTNLANAAKAGHRHGASGYLITDWGDYGHLQAPAISWPGWLAGAAWSWNVASADPERLAPLRNALSHFLFRTKNTKAAEALWEMGRAYLDCELQPSNGSSLFFILRYADLTMDHPRLNGLSVSGLEKSRERLKRARALIRDAIVNRDDEAWLREELHWGLDVIDFACELGQAWVNAGQGKPLSAVDARQKRSLKPRLEELVHRFPAVRGTRFRPGGTKDALRYLERILPHIT